MLLYGNMQIQKSFAWGDMWSLRWTLETYIETPLPLLLSGPATLDSVLKYYIPCKFELIICRNPVHREFVNLVNMLNS